MTVLKLTKSVLAHCLKSNAPVKIDLPKGTSSPEHIYARYSDITHKTGLLPPHPKELKVLSLNWERNGVRHNHHLCLSEQQIEDHFVRMLTPKEGRIFEVIQDTSPF